MYNTCLAPAHPLPIPSPIHASHEMFIVFFFNWFPGQKKKTLRAAYYLVLDLHTDEFIKIAQSSLVSLTIRFKKQEKYEIVRRGRGGGKGGEGGEGG